MTGSDEKPENYGVQPPDHDCLDYVTFAGYCSRCGAPLVITGQVPLSQHGDPDGSA